MSSTRNLCSMFSNIVGRAAGYAAVGAASGAVGAKILLDAGYQDYSVLEATRKGAAGSVVVGAALGMLQTCFGKDNQQTGLVSEIVFSIGALTLGGILGHAMLKNLTEMSLAETAAALAVGSSVLEGAALTLTVIVGCCALIRYGTPILRNASPKEESAPRMTSTPSFFSHDPVLATRLEEAREENPQLVVNTFLANAL